MGKNTEGDIGCVSTEKRFNRIIACREYRDPFVWSQSINSRKASFSRIPPVETHNNQITISRSLLSVQEFPDIVEAEFYLRQCVQSICVCVCSVETKATF